jgi:hypothetical protein
LPGRKALLKSDVEYDVVLIDATETPIERLKKAKALLFWEEKKAHSEESNCCGQKEPTNHLHSICEWQTARLQIIQGVKNTDAPINKCCHRQWVSGTPKDSRQNTNAKKKKQKESVDY